MVVGEAASEKIRSQTPAKDKCRRKSEGTGLVALLSRSERNRSSLRLLCQWVNDDGEGECGATPLTGVKLESSDHAGVAGETRREKRAVDRNRSSLSHLRRNNKKRNGEAGGRWSC
ncbi:hypothetical protein JCGZ_18230 [Jatropha curcas]|uniref:Uncharacterized protein n=1 Tax=Jatropha curcas TaxID=180498 RepID=A0A067KE37_JATCU|nr:hypothetical protein JCGZ_18230 [Jatropha curcas]